MGYTFHPMTPAAAHTIRAWRYAGREVVYNLAPAEHTYMTDPANGFFAVQADQGELVGFCSLGPDGRVPGYPYDAGALDVGAGLRPDLVGAGRGAGFLTAILAFARQRHAPTRFRVTIAAWNSRAQHLALRTGFAPVVTFPNPAGTLFTVLEQNATRVPATLHAAQAGDAPALATVMRAAWPGEMADIPRIAAALAEPTHTTLLVEQEGAAVGFVDGFETQATDGTRRWEVDLLAVHPSARGQGLGSRLVLASVLEGWRRGATLARGLIALGNFASERAFARGGFMAEDMTQALYLWSGEGEVRGAEEPDGTLIPVQTLRYRGVWVEGAITAGCLAAAQARCARAGWDVAGALLPLTDMLAIQLAEAEGFRVAGHYRWWVRRA